MDKFWKEISSPFGLIWVAVNEANFLTNLSFVLPEGAKEGQMPLHAVAKQQLFEYFYGKRKDFSLPLQCSGTDFQELVWDSLKKIPYGTTVSYQDIARCIGRPSACRAVGGAVHCNPIGIVIPCHRVIGKKGTLTGYAGGIDKKRELLQIESKERIYFPYDEKETDELVDACPEFSELVKKKGHIYRPLLPDVFTALVNNIVGQQISMKALSTVWDRLIKKTVITPVALISMTDSSYSKIGISGRKASYIRTLSEQVQNHAIDLDGLKLEPDDRVSETLCSIKGIGEWTAEMVMIFAMARPDVFSSKDLGLNRAVAKIMNREHVTEQDMKDFGRYVSPLGTVASFYLWEMN